MRIPVAADILSDVIAPGNKALAKRLLFVVPCRGTAGPYISDNHDSTVTA
jgi:hypothetical protein